MATATVTFSPVELPTKRNSYRLPAAQQDIHSPGWIPLLRSGTPSLTSHRDTEFEKEVSPYNSSPFLPSPTTSPDPQRPSLQQTRSKSSLATDSRTIETETTFTRPPPPPPPPPTRSDSKFTIELPATRPQSRYFERKHDRRSPDGPDSTDTDGTTESEKAASIATSSVLDDQIHALPLPPSSREDGPGKVGSLSTSPSTASSRKPATVTPPTSKYNRKPLPSTSRLPSAPPSVQPTPQASPKLAPRSDSLPTQPSSSQTEPLAPPPEPEQHSPSRKASGALQPAKSSASQRRKRALHSHPSNVSLKSRPASPSDDSDVAPPPSSTSRPGSSHRPRKSTDSRAPLRASLFDSQTPTPAPTGPLPELPPHARRSANNSVSLPGPTPLASKVGTPALEPSPNLPPPPEAHMASPNSWVSAVGSPNPNPLSRLSSPQATTRPSFAPASPASTTSALPAAPPLSATSPASLDHIALSSFMTNTSTLIFRRFDDVHVQLLLHLQDEIAQFEEELRRLENGTTGPGDRDVQRIRVLRELRGVVSEYDAMFSSWSQMQANKLPSATMDSLKTWLERPGWSAGAGLGIGAQDDLKWLEGAQAKDDLSALHLGSDPPAPDGSEKTQRVPMGTGGVPGGGSSSGSWMSRVFGGCAGRDKRKATPEASVDQR